jgi:hypothetical protein
MFRYTYSHPKKKETKYVKYEEYEKEIVILKSICYPIEWTFHRDRVQRTTPPLVCLYDQLSNLPPSPSILDLRGVMDSIHSLFYLVDFFHSKNIILNVLMEKTTMFFFRDKWFFSDFSHSFSKGNTRPGHFYTLEECHDDYSSFMKNYEYLPENIQTQFLKECKKVPLRQIEDRDKVAVSRYFNQFILEWLKDDFRKEWKVGLFKITLLGILPDPLKRKHGMERYQTHFHKLI